MDKDYDVVVIGAGPGGYKCAIRSAQLGLKVACIDNNDILGGTCLRIGCIPSKALLHSSHEYYNIKNNVSKLGIKAENLSFDLSTMMDFKKKNVEELSQGINFLFNSHKITKFKGLGKILSSENGSVTISVIDGNNDVTIRSKNVVIATGSDVASLPNITIDEKDIISSTSALNFEDIPKKLAVIGAGAIGLEMSSVWSRLGAEVRVIEFLNKIAPAMDNEVSKVLLASLKKQGINFMLSSKVLSAEKTNGKLSVKVESVVDKKQEELEVNKLLVAVGRRPFVKGLFDCNMIELDDRGFIKVNSEYQTSMNNVFAVGDVIGGAMLAHKAEEEGITVAEILAGGIPHVDYDIIPSVIYTHPVAAAIGKTEEQLKNINYKVGKCNFTANGRAKVTNHDEGFVKVISCKSSDRVLGIHIVGSYADTIINEAALAMAYGASSEDIYRTCHSHPDFNEALKDAAGLAFLKQM